MAEVGSLWVRLRGDTKEFESAMKGVSTTLKASGKRMQEVGGGLSKFVTLPMMGLGAAALASATSVEGAMATIRAGTGATGKGLATLGEDFRAVFRRVPENAQQVSTAIADLNTRLGLTGEPLRRLSEQMLELADLTGTQIGPLIASTTRVFGDWSVATAEQAGTLDTLWKVSQTTGIGVDRLANSLVQFGAPLRQMGFSLTESAALMGKWELEGVNMELVLGSLRIAMGNFARDNIPMRAGLDQTMKRIQELGPGAAATALAMEVFGARAGPDMAAAILEGRFAIEELMAQLAASPETIAAAGAETETFAEKMAILRNNATLALEPIGARLMEALTTVMPQLIAAADRVAQLAERFAALTPQTQTTILVMAGLLAILGPVLIVVGKVISVVAGLVKGLAGLKTALAATKVVLVGTTAVAGGTAAKVGILTAAFKLFKLAAAAVTLKVGIVIGVVAALAAGAVLLTRHWDVVTGFFRGLWASVKAIFSGASAAVTATMQSLWDRAVSLVTSMVDRIRGVVAGVVEAIAAPFRSAWGIVSGILGQIAGARAAADSAVQHVAAAASRAASAAAEAARAVAAPIQQAGAAIGNVARQAGNALQQLNPLARRSPSLVDQVRAGVAAIRDEYGKLERLRLPALAMAGVPAGPPRGRTGTITIPIYLDGHMIARAVAPHLVDDIRTKTGVKF